MTNNGTAAGSPDDGTYAMYQVDDSEYATYEGDNGEYATYASNSAEGAMLNNRPRDKTKRILLTII